MITSSKHTLLVNGKSIQFQYPVIDAFEVQDIIVVLFHPDSSSQKSGQFRNLIALKRNGEHLWIAELPTSRTGDRYYKVVSRSPLVVYSVSSFECEIDIDTGRIKSRRFFK